MLIDELKRDEGFVPYAYKDSLGYWTIGYGTLIDKDKGGRIPEDIATLLLQRKLDETKAELINKWPHFTTLDQVRQDVLLNMAYNLGVSGLLKFKQTLQAVMDKNYKLASERMLQSLWAQQVGQRANRLAKKMETGIA